MLEIVCPWAFSADPVVSGHIIPRSARTLAQGLSVPLVTRPTGEKVWRYFFTYQFYDGGEQAVCLFTHKEPPAVHPEKHALWLRACAADVRVSMSERYVPDLGEGRHTFVIPLPYEDQLFTLPAQGHAREGIGAAGISYGDGRKGEHLLARLKADGYSVRMVGKGAWPYSAQWLPFEALPDFYRSLDVFLITSLIEGGPMPLLEALACGTKVVAPRGVGFVDSLSHNPAVFLYEAGNYEDMRESIHRARLARLPHGASLVGLERFTRNTYIHLHNEAFSSIL